MKKCIEGLYNNIIREDLPMWFKFKWDMFITSFIPLWFSITVLDCWDFVENSKKIWNSELKTIPNVIACIQGSSLQVISVCIIFIVVFFSVRGINSFLKNLAVRQDGHTGKIVKAVKANKLSSEFLLAYILPMIAFDFGDIRNLVLFGIYFAVLAMLCIRNNNLYTNIFLEFKKYKLYTCDIQRKILEDTKLYCDSLVISKDDLTQRESDNILCWDFENYIYIIIDGGVKT